MIHALMLILGLALSLQTLIALSFLLSCITESERRAAIFAVFQFLGSLALLGLFIYLRAIGFFTTRFGTVTLVGSVLLLGLAVFLLFRRSPPNRTALKGSRGYIVGEVKRYDERDIVFARNRSLRPDSEQYRTFYERHPDYEEVDRRRRAIGGPLGKIGSLDSPHEGANTAAALASATIPMLLSDPRAYHPQPNPARRGETVSADPRDLTSRVKGYARRLGADLVGITELNTLWIYSNRGEIFRENWEDWGREIAVNHPFAIVFATEMHLDLVTTAPHTPTVIESMCNYSEGAYIATQLAAFIANLGYSATANHLRHYDAVLVPLAVDAGLGEMGRLGYLMTKQFGPRVRLAAVTTNLPLIPDKPLDIGIEDFCRSCQKCGLCCPSQSIPLGSPAQVNGTLRWKLNAETCFEYWGKVGTDCNICMRVCPWSHARTFPHRLIVALVSRNALARRVFTIMDDIFYGRKPRAKTAPEWARYGPA
jgi:reductive dehalogenase